MSYVQEMVLAGHSHGPAGIRAPRVRVRLEPGRNRPAKRGASASECQFGSVRPLGLAI